MRTLPSILIAFSLIASASLAMAQNAPDSRGIGVPPEVPIPLARPRLGIEMGMGQDLQYGSFTCPCGTTFTSGRGTAYFGSVFFELPVGPDFFAGITAGYDKMNTTNTTPENEIVRLESPSASQIDTVSLLINRTGSFTLSMLRFEPYLQYQVFHSNFFIQLGAGISAYLTNSLTQTREIASGTVTLSDGSQINNVGFTNGTRTEDLPQSNVQGINSFQFSGLFSAGYNFDLGKITLAPIVTYDYPFSSISSQNSGNWKIASLDGSVALLFSI